MFVKSRLWFKIKTPIDTYNPDWAIVKEHDEKVYLVCETKSTKDQVKLRGSEWAKIRYGKVHYEELEGGFRPCDHNRRRLIPFPYGYWCLKGTGNPRLKPNRFGSGSGSGSGIINK